MKKYFWLIILAVLVLLVFFYFRSVKTPDVSKNENIILFYGNECPHCRTVEKYIDENKISEKINFSQAEVFHNDNNQAVFIEKYKICGVTDEEDLGVPMLYADGKCYVGQDEVIGYFQKSVNSNL